MKRVLFGLGTVLGIAALIALAVLFHSRAVKSYGEAQERKGSDAAYTAVENRALKAEAEAARLAAKLRERNDADNRAITSHARTLSLHGPGKAACTGTVSTPAPASGHVEGDGATVTAVGGLPDPQWNGLLALPFSPTIAAFAQCDANRAEVEAWRAQRQQQYNDYAAEKGTK